MARRLYLTKDGWVSLESLKLARCVFSHISKKSKILLLTPYPTQEGEYSTALRAPIHVEFNGKEFLKRS